MQLQNQQTLKHQLKQLKVAERESREGLMTTELNHKQLFKQEKLSYAAKLAMLKKLLPAPGSKEEAKMEARTLCLLPRRTDRERKLYL